MFSMGAFNVEDFRYILRNLKPEERREWYATRGNENPVNCADYLKPFANYASIAYHDYEPVAIMGAVPIRPGVFNAYMIATPGLNRVGLQFTKWARREFFPALRMLGAHRVEAHVIADYDETHRWIRAIGAKVEALVPRFGVHGEDFVRFVYLWD